MKGKSVRKPRILLCFSLFSVASPTFLVQAYQLIQSMNVVGKGSLGFLRGIQMWSSESNENIAI